jgi:hypothetical protein
MIFAHYVQKVSLIALAVVALSLTARADSATIVDVSVTGCSLCYTTPSDPTPRDYGIDLEMQLAVESVTGTFLIPGYDVTEDGVFEEIVSMTGTLNGDTITMTPPGQGDGDWVLPFENSFQPGWVTFTADGVQYSIGNDFAYNLLTSVYPDGSGTFFPIIWTATVPEPSALQSLVLGLSCLAILASWLRTKERRRRRKCVLF